MSAAPKIQITPADGISPAKSGPRSPALLGRQTDAWMVGGASLLTYFGFQIFSSQDIENPTLAITMYVLSFVVNYPHFMFSYLLLYVDRRRDLLHKPAYTWAAFGAPGLLLALSAWGFWRHDELVFSLLIQVMFLTVGWHYVKQVFGTIIVSSAKIQFYFTKNERRLLLANLYSLWALSFFYGQSQARESADFFGVTYDLLRLGPAWVNTASVAVAVSGAAVIAVFVHRYWREGRWPSTTALVSFATLYVWYLPMMGHRHFFYMIPFFHSIQYFLFVGALKKNQWKEKFHDFRTREDRGGMLRSAGFFLGAALLSGTLLFWLIPAALDRLVASEEFGPAPLWSPMICTALFQVFINIHHYFIDNVIWKNDNPDVKSHLL